MIPAGYMAKKISKKPDWIEADNVVDIYSVSNCISDDFADYIKFWKHNGYWFFDSPDIIYDLIKENSLDASELKFFYYEVHEEEYSEDDNQWHKFQPEASFTTAVTAPAEKKLEGYDVVTFRVHTNPECSPLSCNNLAKDFVVNQHCLFASFEDAKRFIENGIKDDASPWLGEPGPYRIFAVNTLPA